MGKHDNIENLDDNLTRLNISRVDLSNYEADCILKIDSYFNDKLTDLKRVLHDVSFQGVSTTKVLKELELGKNTATRHRCIAKYIDFKNKEYTQMLHTFVNQKATNITEVKRQNKLLKDRDTDYELTKIALEEKNKEISKLHKEIERLNKVIAYRNLAN